MESAITTIGKENTDLKPNKVKIYHAIKVIFLGLVYIGSALGFAYYWGAFLREGVFSYLVIAGLCAGLLAVFSAVSVFVTPGSGIVSVFAFFSAVIALFPFLSHLEESRGFLLIFSAFVFFGFSFLGLRRGNDILENGLNIRFFHGAKAVIPKVLTGTAIFASTIFYFSYFEWGQLNENLTKRAGDEFVSSMERPLRAWFPGISADQKINDFLKIVVGSRLEKLAESGQTGSKKELGLDDLTRLKLPAAEKEKIIKEGADILKGELENIAGPLSGDELVKDVAYQIARSRIIIASEKFGTKSFFGGAAAAFVFFAIQSFIFIFRWPLEVLAFMVYECLIITNFARVEFKSAVKETIVI